MTRVLISGGAGFLGSHLTARLVESGRDVVVVDNLWTGREENLERLLGEDWDLRVEFVEASVEDAGTYFSGDQFDEIYHLASPASPPTYMQRPLDTMTANFIGATALLPFLREGGRFCYTSTSEVYGDPEVSPLPETYRGRVDCTGPRSSYDESKRATEALLHELHRTEGLDVRVVRIFNSYGPGTRPDDGRAVSNFITAALRGEPIVVQGDGLQTRCFGYVTDTVEGLWRYFVEAPADVPRVMNIGNDHEVTVLRVAEMVRDLIPGSTIAHADPAPQDPHQRRPDLARAQEWLPGWDPYSVPLSEGLRKTISYFRGELGL